MGRGLLVDASSRGKAGGNLAGTYIMGRNLRIMIKIPRVFDIPVHDILYAFELAILEVGFTKYSSPTPRSSVRYPDRAKASYLPR